MNAEQIPEFKDVIRRYLVWSFRLEPRGSGQTLRSKLSVEDSADEAAVRVLEEMIIPNVRGNHGLHAEVTAAHLDAIMDQVAALHLRLRHGPGAVSATAVADISW